MLLGYTAISHTSPAITGIFYQSPKTEYSKNIPVIFLFNFAYSCSTQQIILLE